MHMIGGRMADAIRRLKDAIRVSVEEAKIEKQRQEDVRISTEITLEKNEKAAIQKAMDAAKKKNLSEEDTNALLKKTKRNLQSTMASKRAMLRRRGGKKSPAEAIVSLQTLKGFVHMVALNNGAI